MWYISPRFGPQKNRSGIGIGSSPVEPGSPSAPNGLLPCTAIDSRKEMKLQTYGRQLSRRLLSRIAPTLRSRSLPGIPGRVHYNDLMLFDDSAESIDNYMRAARSAVENIEKVLGHCGRSFDTVASCLDFGCGHGRVLRLLVRRIGASAITACDVDREGVRFCVAEFGVRGLFSRWKIDDIRFGSYDLIWSGSVFTHLDAEEGELLLARLGESLVPGGVLVFSLHGELSLQGLGHLYGGLYAHEAETIRREVEEKGLSFRAYDSSFGSFEGKYGMTWHSREYVESRAREVSRGRLQLLSWIPQGWDSHHDVVAFRKI